MPNEIVGFVYLWLDSGRHSASHLNQRMFCLGSHRGAEDDGYLTSTGGRHFKAAYRKRPQDFKRRIIERVYEGTGRDVLNAEQRWLDLIKPEELHQRYYNVKKTAMGLSREDTLRLHEADPTYRWRIGAGVRAAHEADPTLKSRIGEGVRAAHEADPTLGHRIGASIRAAYESNPQYRENLIAGQRAAHEADPTIVVRRGATWHTLYESDPTLGRRIGEGVRAAHEADPMLRVRMGAAISVGVYATYKADPTNRQRAGATRSATYKANPEFGLRMSASQLEAYEKDPTLRDRKSVSMRAVQARKTPEQLSEIAMKAAKTLRARQNEVIITLALWLHFTVYKGLS